MWSTVVDAPITHAMTQAQLERYVKRNYGQRGLDGLPAQLARIKAKGASWFDSEKDLAATLAGNRAGPDETYLTADEIYDRYS